jgi:hypothetical protein
MATPGAEMTEIRRNPRLRTLVVRLGAFVSGVLVLYHEVFIASTSEPLLVFLGLWLCGIPPAMFFDGLRKLTEQAKDSLAETVEGLDVPTKETHETDA